MKPIKGVLRQQTTECMLEKKKAEHAIRGSKNIAVFLDVIAKQDIIVLLVFET